MSDNLLPDNYEVPQKTGNYMRWQDGENKFRFLSSAIIGWETWQDLPDGSRKPLRTPMDKPFSVEKVPSGDPMDIKHFWAVIVWNYKEEKIQILEITQKGIQKSLRALERSKDWGSLLDYDILVTKEGQKLETEYHVNPVPPKPLSREIEKVYAESNIDLKALYTGTDPFSAKTTEVDVNDIPDDLSK